MNISSDQPSCVYIYIYLDICIHNTVSQNFARDAGSFAQFRVFD